MKWLSLHIFYYDNTIFLISKLLPSLFNELNDKFHISKFFYIIYYEKGPHIRVRLLCEDEELNSCAELSVQRIYAFLQLYPSTSLQIIRKDWYPNNSVHIIDYQPEFERYGGTQRIQIAESYFTYSTIAALAILQKNYKNYIKNFNAAIELHLIFSSVLFNGDFAKMKALFEYIYQATRVNQSAGRFFTKYEDNIMSSVSKTIKIALEKKTIDSKLLTWHHHICKIVDELNNTVGDGTQLWKMLVSYFHMTNNRLGIQTPHEEYLYYFILKKLNAGRIG